MAQLASISKRHTLYPSNDSVHIFFIFSALFKDAVYFMFFNEILLHMSIDQKGDFLWGRFFSYPIIALLVITDVLTIIEMSIQSRVAYIDPKTMTMGKSRQIW